MNSNYSYYLLITVLLFLAPLASANCVKCTTGPGGQTAWANTTAIGTVGAAGGAAITPAQAACSLALPGSAPAVGAGSSYVPKAGSVCGAPCSNQVSDCGAVNATQCDSDYFADDIETCSAVAGTLFVCNWTFAQDCCGASPPGDTCSQTGIAPNTTASCGVGGCGVFDRTFGSVVPPANDDYVEIALIAALLISVLFIARRFFAKTNVDNSENQQ